MPKYKVRVEWVTHFEAIIDADDELEAWEKGKEMDQTEFTETESEWIVDDEVERVEKEKE